MKRRMVQGLLIASLVLVTRGAAGSREPARSDCLYLVFCPLLAEQSSRAAQAERLAGLLAADLPVAAVPCGLGSIPVDPEAVRIASGLSCPVIAGDTSFLPVEVDRLRAGTEDWAVLIRDGGAVAVARVEDTARLLASAGAAAATDINDSTWGKIKEIFQ
jgi:hypothetical protein